MMDIDPTKALQAAVRIGFDEAKAQAQEEIEKLRAALKPFANIASNHTELDDEDYISVHPYKIRLKHFRAIDDALGEKE